MPDGLRPGRGRAGVRILVTTDAVGGVWTYALDLCRGLSARGMGVVLAVMGPPPSPAQRTDASGVPGLMLVDTGLALDWTAKAPAEVSGAASALAELATWEQVDSIHLHAPALVGSASWPAPVVAVTHSCVATWWDAVRGGALPDDLAWRAALTGQGLRRADAVIAPSAAHAAAVMRAYGAQPIRVVHNGAAARPIPRGPRSGVLTAGRLWDEAKGVALLEEASAGLTVRAAGPLVGPNGQGIVLRHIEHLGILDSAAMQEAYARHRAYASLALYEPFGLAVLEAASAGMALVLRDIPVFRELWDGAALFVSDIDDLPRALRTAITDDQWGARARDRAARYTVAAMVDQTWAVHRDLASVPA